MVFTSALYILSLATSVITVALTVAYLSFRWKYQYWKRKNVPFIEPTIPFGSIGNILTRPRDERLADIYRDAKSKGWSYCGLFLLLSPVLLIVDIDLIKNVLKRDFQYFSDRGTYINEKDDPIGSHLFTISGSKWKSLRTKLIPAFSSGKLKGMFQTLVDCGLNLEKYIDENVTKDVPVEIETVMKSFSTNIMESAVFGIEHTDFKNSAAFDSLLEYFVVSKLDTFLWLFVDNFPRISRLLGLRQVKRKIGDFFKEFVEKTVAFREKNNYIRKDFMQLLIDIKNGDRGTLTMNEISAQAFLFFIAGSGSTATTLTFALFELAAHPDLQDRLRTEIQEILAKHDGEMTYDCLNEMKYMGQVISEILRMYSTATAIERRCTSDYKIPDSNLVLRKGTRVLISVRGVHNDPEYWKNPEVFDPERFSERSTHKFNQFAHLPFGQGPRGCLAERFGRMQVKVGLASVLRKYRVSLNEKTKMPLTMSLNSIAPVAEGGIWLNLEKV